MGCRKPQLYTGRKEDEDLIQSKGVVYPSQITADDKIYVFPGCSIKKLPLRKWIKSIGARQVHDVAEATCVVVRDKLTGGVWDWKKQTFEIIEWYWIEKGEYKNPHVKERYPTRYEESKWVTSNIYSNFIWKTKFSRNPAISHLTWSDQKKHAERYIQNECSSQWKVTINNQKVNATHIHALMLDKVKMVNHLDLQQVVYDWEVWSDQ